MNCPACDNRCNLKGNFYKCRFCGAEERFNTTGKGTMWIQNGKVISAPQAEKEQLEKAKEKWPSGDWKD